MADARAHAGAVLLYAATALAYLDHGASLTDDILGAGQDPGLTIWFLAWWPWAIAHHVTTLHTHLIWQPTGQNLGWTTCVPLLALLASPITLLGGPVLAFNLLTLIAPVAAALSAYALCLELGAAPAAALIGGWLFGFSSYEATESFTHLNLDTIALVPLLCLVASRRLRGALGRPAAVLWFGLLLGGQFLISDEVFATFVTFGAFASALAWLSHPAARPALQRFAADLLIAAPICILIASPLWLGMLAGRYDIALPASWKVDFCTDLLNLLIPARGTLVGGAAAAAISINFPGGLDEQSGYLGVPLLAALALSARAGWRRPLVRLLCLWLVLAVVASFGAHLWVAGALTPLPMPWALASNLPLLGNALPARFMLYADLLSAILVALWLTAAPTRRNVWLAVIACVAWLPIPHPVTPVPVSPFFAPGRVQAVLGPAPRLLILPFGDAGPSDLWQVENRFGFSEAGGYLSYPPAPMRQYPAVLALSANKDIPGMASDLATFCAATGVTAVVAGPGTLPAFLATLRTLRWPARRVDDVIIFTPPAHA